MTEANGTNGTDTNGTSSQSDTPSVPVAIPDAFIAMPLLQQSGKVYVGPGARKEAELLGLGLMALSSRQVDDLDRAKRFAMEVSTKFVLQKQQLAHQQHQQKVAMYAQALSLMSRVYIGSVSFEVREDQLKSAFGVFGPIKTINMSWDASTGHHKGFAFLEYEVPEAAQLAQESMNGRTMGGRQLKVNLVFSQVGRPTNMPQAQQIIEMIQQEAKQHHRVYVASVHPELSETDLRTVFDAFGQITKCQLAKQPGGRGHRGFGYLEFTTAKAVKDAIEGMNNFDLGGQYLQVGRSITPPDALTYVVPSTQSTLPTRAAVAAAEVTAKIQALQAQGGADKSSPTSSTPGARSSSPALQDKHSPSPTPATSVTPTQGSDSPVQADGTPPPPSESPQANPAPRRRRGFGGFAAAAPPPAIVQPIPPPSLTIPQMSAACASLQPPPPAPIEVVPVATAAPPQPPLAFLANIPEPPPMEPALPMFIPAKSKKKKKEKKDKGDVLSRIKLENFVQDPSAPATFAPLDDYLAPKEKGGDEENGASQLMIGGPEAWSALALREDSSKAVTEYSTDAQKAKAAQDAKAKQQQRPKAKKPKKVRMPKLTSAGALNAVYKAGAINDQMQAAAAQNEEATLASQEHVEIRGNDARHMLMHKLMRTNRSSVIVLKNMVTADGIDDELEDEVRDECTKFGQVVDVVIVQEENSEEVKIFVKFGDPTQAEAARQVFDGRYFDGKTVAAVSYDQALFDHDDFTGQC